MDSDRFDHVTRIFSHLLSRRLLAGGLGLATIGVPGLAEVKKKKGKKRIKRNDFGCVNVGNFCKNNGQCCSGKCKGKKGKKRCKAHDTGGCTGDQDVCEGEVVPCVTTTGESGACVRTTGNAGFCNVSGSCFPCRRDPDCQAMFGPQAACIVCEIECGPKGTACVGPSEGE